MKNVKVGIVDIGSNTVRLVIYKVDDKKYKKMFSQKKMLGLIGYIEEKNLNAKGRKKLVKTMDTFLQIMKIFAVDEYHFFATASLRNIQNIDEILEYAKKKTKIEIDIISGEQEGYLDYLAVKNMENMENGMILDVGGGSSEIVIVKHGKVKENNSHPIGSLNLYHKYVENVLPTWEEQLKIEEEIQEVLKKQKREKQEKMIGIGGSMRAALSLCNEILEVTDIDPVLTIENFEEILYLLRTQPQAAIKHILRRKPDRIHTIVPGILVIKNVMEYYQCEKIKVNDAGVREGYLTDKVIGE